MFGEVFGDAVADAISAALPPDEHGWQELTLSFEHELAPAGVDLLRVRVR